MWRRGRHCRRTSRAPQGSVLPCAQPSLAAARAMWAAMRAAGLATSTPPAPPACRAETIAVCTLEKANATVNRLAHEGRLGELCCVVVDELHMVSCT